MDNINKNAFCNWYQFLDIPQKYKYAISNYTSFLVSLVSEMFTIPEMTALQTNTLMNIMLTHGTCLIDTRIPDKIMLCDGYYSGVPEYGEILPPLYIATKALNNGTYTFSDNPANVDGVTVAYLNPYMSPLTEIQRFAAILSDIDTSLRNNIMFCRIAPIGVTQDDNSRAAYEQAVEKMIDGELINSVKAQFDFNNNTPASLTTIDISNGDYANKLQYLSMLHEQILSRFCKMVGIPYNVLSKSANITTDELGNIDTFASILPRNMLNCLNESLSKIGFHAEFSPQWEWINNINDMKNSSGDIDDSETNIPNITDDTEQEENNNV